MIDIPADLNESRPNQLNIYDRPPGHFVNNDFMAARLHQPNVAHIMALNGPQEGPFVETRQSPQPTAAFPPPSPTESSSTRWLTADTTQTIYPPQSVPELYHDASAWVDYDVVDFLDHWDIQYYMGEAGLTHVDDERKGQWQPQAQRQRFSQGRDLQGLDWSVFNTTRSKARLARKMLYPLRYSCTSPVRYGIRALHRQEHMYTPLGFYPHHKANHSHGQLRNLLAARSRNDIFYASKSRVMHTTLSCPDYTNVVVNFSGASTNPNQAEDTQITTIAVSPATDFDGYYSDVVLVTGGLTGEYSLLNLNSALGDPPTEGFVTVAEENATTHVHVLGHRRTGAPGAAFCSNDSKVRLLDITTNTWTHSFAYEHRVNCAATSPDGRLRAIVGDTCDTLITDAERGDVQFRTRQHTGYGFACAWADDGRHVATGGEDGKVVVYDARRWDVPLAALACEMSCARSLHFATSDRGTPSLVVAESDDIVSVYDAGDWLDKQTVDFFGSVVGAASVDGGQELLVANGDKTVGGLMVFERRDRVPDEPDDVDLLDCFAGRRYGRARLT